MRKDIVLTRRHENLLNDLLETVAFEGYAHVPKWRLLRWYEFEHFVATIRRDLRDRWNTLVTQQLGWEEVPTLWIAEGKGGDIVLIHDDTFPEED